MKYIAGNWKLYKNPSEARAFFRELKALLASQGFSRSSFSHGKKILIFPSAPCFEAVANCIDSLGIPMEWGGQNCYSELKGAFTGEISAKTIKDLGGQWVLLGHSERRTLFKEESFFIASKLYVSQSLGLTPLVCVGENLQERQNGQTNSVLFKQLQESLSKAEPTKSLAIAYEPVWAIGTGLVASIPQIEDAHGFIHETLNSFGLPNIPILYGGSVKPENAQTLSRVSHVGGFLIGGASLESEAFSQIYFSSEV